MTPAETATVIRAGLAAAPQGKIGAVSVSSSGPKVYHSPFDTVKAYLSVITKTAVDVFGPSEFNIPGTAPIARSVGKSVMKVGNEVSAGVHKAAESATEGIKSGFKYGTLIIVVIVGVWLWSVVKPR